MLDFEVQGKQRIARVAAGRFHAKLAHVLKAVNAMGEYSRLLFADPSFLSGAASLLDIGDALFEFNQSMTTAQADRTAINSDWMQVYRDLSESYHRFQMEHPECLGVETKRKIKG